MFGVVLVPGNPVVVEKGEQLLTILK